jgi:ABC-type phosphate/phosphonate transport system substrate-binding protein
MRLVSYMAPGFPHSLFTALAKVMGAEVSFDETLSGPAPGHDPFADGSADFGWICSTSFVDLATRSDVPSVVLAGGAWVPDDPDANGRPVYFGDIVARPDSPITCFADLGGTRIGCNDPVSLSGHHSLRLAMAERELADDFADLVFTGGHHRSLDLLLAGEVDAAVVDSVVRTGRARQDPQVADLRIIERLGPWPVQPLVARSSLDPNIVRGVRHALLAACEAPEIKAELEAACLTGLVEVGPDHYAGIRAALQRSPI